MSGDIWDVLGSLIDRADGDNRMDETTTTTTELTDLQVSSVIATADTLVAMSEVAADATYAFYERLRRNSGSSFGLSDAVVAQLTAAWLQGGMSVPAPSEDTPE